jgi:hypothetical protein
MKLKQNEKKGILNKMRHQQSDFPKNLSLDYACLQNKKLPMLQNVPFQDFASKILSNYSLPVMTKKFVYSSISFVKLFSLTEMRLQNKLEGNIF